jgi:hypothetical protein
MSRTYYVYLVNCRQRLLLSLLLKMEFPCLLHFFKSSEASQSFHRDLNGNCLLNHQAFDIYSTSLLSGETFAFFCDYRTDWMDPLLVDMYCLSSQKALYA